MRRICRVLALAVLLMPCFFGSVACNRAYHKALDRDEFWTGPPRTITIERVCDDCTDPALKVVSHPESKSVVVKTFYSPVPVTRRRFIEGTLKGSGLPRSWMQEFPDYGTVMLGGPSNGRALDNEPLAEASGTKFASGSGHSEGFLERKPLPVMRDPSDQFFVIQLKRVLAGKSYRCGVQLFVEGEQANCFPDKASHQQMVAAEADGEEVKFPHQVPNQAGDGADFMLDVAEVIDCPYGLWSTGLLYFQISAVRDYYHARGIEIDDQGVKLYMVCEADGWAKHPISLDRTCFLEKGRFREAGVGAAHQ